MKLKARIQSTANLHGLAIGVAAILLAASPVASAALTSSTVTNGNTTIVSFTAGSGFWMVPEGVTNIQLLVVGGGGGGGNFAGAGGGGGFLSISSYAVTFGSSIMVDIGLGGAGGTGTRRAAGTVGSQSVFDSLIAYGGQGGYWINGSSTPGNTAGHGGTSGTNNYDSVGGLVADAPANNAYGSGSGVGFKGIVANNAAGGAGLSSDITGSTVWYGGGGGALVQGLGGQGGGGAGSASTGTTASAGLANTGGGGGAGWVADGGSGGSGVVILSYTAIPEPTAALLGGLGFLALLRRRRN